MNSLSGHNSDSKLVDKIGQFVTVPFSFIQASKELSFHACWLFVILRFYTNGRTGNAFPSYTTIRNVTGMRRQKISESLKELEEAGWLKKQSRFGKANLYTLVIPKPSAKGQDADGVQVWVKGGGRGWTPVMGSPQENYESEPYEIPF